jgi:uncharacterized HhH-GPD family protein
VAVTELPFTDDPEACALIAQDPFALLVGFSLDQQVTVQKAFAGPLELRRRLGHLDARRIAAMDPDELAAIFAERPALHRFPGSMARRVHDLAAFVVDRYDGDAGRVWGDAATGEDLQRRVRELPGFGDMKVRALTAVLVKQLGVRPAGWERVVPGYPTLGDVDSPEALARYQEHKRAQKRARRAAG